MKNLMTTILFVCALLAACSTNTDTSSKDAAVAEDGVATDSVDAADAASMTDAGLPDIHVSVDAVVAGKDTTDADVPAQADTTATNAPADATATD